RRRNRARREKFVIVQRQPILIGEGLRDRRKWRRCTASQWRRQGRVRTGLGRVQQIDLLIRSRVHRLVLGSARIVRSRRAVSVDNPFGQQVQDSLVLVDRLIGREKVIEGAVLADNDNDVLYWCNRIGVIA